MRIDMSGCELEISPFAVLFLAFALSILLGVLFRLNPLIALAPLGIAFVTILYKGFKNGAGMKKEEIPAFAMTREEILGLIDMTSQDDDVGFQKIIFAVLDGGYLTARDLAHVVGASLPTVERWRGGKSSPHPAMRKHIFKYLRESLTCLCPKKCDCQNPPPKNWDGKNGAYHVSEMCPEHNHNPRPYYDCPVHYSVF